MKLKDENQTGKITGQHSRDLGQASVTWALNPPTECRPVIKIRTNQTVKVRTNQCLIRDKTRNIQDQQQIEQV